MLTGPPFVPWIALTLGFRVLIIVVFFGLKVWGWRSSCWPVRSCSLAGFLSAGGPAVLVGRPLTTILIWLAHSSIIWLSVSVTHLCGGGRRKYSE